MTTYLTPYEEGSMFCQPILTLISIMMTLYRARLHKVPPFFCSVCAVAPLSKQTTTTKNNAEIFPTFSVESAVVNYLV